MEIEVTDTIRKELMLVFYAFAGGFADATSYLSFRTFTGHVTGNLILLMVAAAQRDWSASAIRHIAVSCFLLATRVGSRLAAHSRPTVTVFGCQVALLIAPAWLAFQQKTVPLVGVPAFCLALGLQNGVSTSVLDIDVHTTFVSGDFTSLVKSSVAVPEQDRKQKRNDLCY